MNAQSGHVSLSVRTLRWSRCISSGDLLVVHVLDVIALFLYLLINVCGQVLWILVSVLCALSVTVC